MTTECAVASGYAAATASLRISEMPAAGWASRPPAFADVFRSITDGLSEQIALLDENWGIIAVNRSWAKAVEQYGCFELVPGGNYLAFTQAKASAGYEPAATVAAAIGRIDGGARQSFSFVYEGPEQWSGRDFRLSIQLTDVAGHSHAIVTRYDVTELVQDRELRNYLNRSVAVGQDQERRRIAREIHDSTMQTLVGLGLTLSLLKRSTKADARVELVAEMEQLLGAAQSELRSFSYLAHPPLLEKLGLRGAVEALVEGYSRRTGLDISFHFDAPPDVQDENAELILYRVIQEGLSNVHRHARAARATAIVCARRSMIHAVVADDGIGMTTINRGVGLSSMKARLSEIGGRLTIKTSPHGTTVIASVPTMPRIRRDGGLSPLESEPRSLQLISAGYP